MATLTALTGEALLVHGGPTMHKYTPNADVDVGDVVLLGAVVCIAHLAIPADELGALAVGGAVYRGIKDGTSGPAIAAGDPIFWDNSGRLFTNVETNYYAGTALEAAGANVAYVIFQHDPIVQSLFEDS